VQVHGQSVDSMPNPQSRNSQGSPAHQTKGTTTREWSTTTHVRELTHLAFDATSCFRLSVQEAKLLPMTGTQLQYPLGRVVDLKARTLSRANSLSSKGKWFKPDAIPRML
jgi:hypothetical protein